MTFRQAFFESVAQRNGHQGGWNSAFDRLAEFLAQESNNRRRSGNDGQPHSLARRMARCAQTIF